MKTRTFISLFIVLLFALNVNAGLISKIKSVIGNIKNLLNDENVAKNIYLGGSTSNYADVYYKKSEVDSKKEVVIFVHGGTWVAGDKVENSKIGSLLCKNDYVGVVANYVLFPKGRVDDMVNDVYNAVEWTYNNIEQYGGDKKKIILAGYSAGAHLSALTLFKSHLGMKNHRKPLEPLPELHKIVFFNGPFDFDNYDAVAKLLKLSDVDDGIIESLVSLLLSSKDVSPTDIVRDQKSNSIQSFGVPTMTFFYADEDKAVPIESSPGLIKEIERVSPDTVINEVFNQGNHFDHGTLINGARDDDEELGQMFIDIINM